MAPYTTQACAGGGHPNTGAAGSTEQNQQQQQLSRQQHMVAHGQEPNLGLGRQGELECPL